MSLIRQIWLLLLATLLLAFFGSFAVWMLSARGYLETQLRLKNADNAQSLALSLSQQKGDRTAMELTASAVFDTGFYQRVTLRDGAGRVLFSRDAEADAVRPRAPAWFAQMVTVTSAPGVAQVSDGWRALGSVEVVSHAAFAYDQLWQGALKTVGLLSVLGALAAGAAAYGVRRIRTPLDATVAQAQALMERRFVTVPEPAVPELARLSRAMNEVVQRLKLLFDEQSSQVEQLRQQAHCDPLTRLSHRAHFMTQLRAMLATDESAGEGMLYLIRVVDLAGINRQLGHRATDALLQKVSDVLRGVWADVAGVARGRLNGGDFAVLVGQGDVAPPPAAYYADLLRRALTEMASPAQIVVGAVRWSRGMPVAQVLAAADSALARAESRGPFAVETAEMPQSDVAVLGEEAWRERLDAALQAGRMELVRFPVVGRDQLLVHHECPLRIQLEDAGTPEPAARWLPMALRTGLIARIDEAAVALALLQIARDHEPLGVNLSPASLADSSFVPRLRARLASMPEAARHLWLEVDESAAIDRFDMVRELCKQLRPLGARVGLEHAGDRLARINLLFEAGLDYVKLGASVVQGVAQDPARSAYVTATVGMLHGLGLQVFAEGVSDPADIVALHQAGLDGVTGPAVRLTTA